MVASAASRRELRAGPLGASVTRPSSGQFDYEAVANRLFEEASQPHTPSQNRKRLYKVVRKLQHLAEGEHGRDPDAPGRRRLVLQGGLGRVVALAGRLWSTQQCPVRAAGYADGTTAHTRPRDHGPGGGPEPDPERAAAERSHVHGRRPSGLCCPSAALPRPSPGAPGARSLAQLPVAGAGTVTWGSGQARVTSAVPPRLFPEDDVPDEVYRKLQKGRRERKAKKPKKRTPKPRSPGGAASHAQGLRPLALRPLASFRVHSLGARCCLEAGHFGLRWRKCPAGAALRLQGLRVRERRGGGRAPGAARRPRHETGPQEAAAALASGLDHGRADGAAGATEAAAGRSRPGVMLDRLEPGLDRSRTGHVPGRWEQDWGAGPRSRRCPRAAGCGPRAVPVCMAVRCEIKCRERLSWSGGGWALPRGRALERVPLSAAVEGDPLAAEGLHL
ncbi:Ribosomal RNA processing protein 1A [Galemys pyrenaicus]|uniref:Ribosomal RNA processing protein 1A n=1 Tax=Galemys pyrenaicus TaxID=202257 RepID=A0A8J6DEZ9_GALPY|nr:Ribosomal RNA processing protein 1A [Galemys pyrenaicus]